MSDLFNPIYARIRKRIADKVRVELRHASDRKLKSIVRAYKKLPFYYRWFNLPCNEELQFERSLRYFTARDIRSGKFSWEELERNEAEQERAKELIGLREENIEKYKHIELSDLSIFEFERLKGRQYEFVGGLTSYDRYTNEEEKAAALIANGVEAFVRFRPFGDSWHGRGYPVRKVKKEMNFGSCPQI